MLRVALDELCSLGADNPTDLIFGADIDDGTVEWAAHLVSQGVPTGQLRAADFLSLIADVDLPRTSAVVGNPPYVKHQRLTAPARAQAVAAAESAGVRLSGRASLWAYFVVHAAQFVLPGGRMALLLPGAVLQADYAPNVLTYLQRSFEDVLFIRVRERIFEDTQEETVALLAHGAGTNHPGRVCRYAEVHNLAGLEQFVQEPLPSNGTPAHELPGVANWKTPSLSSLSLDVLTRVLADSKVRPLSAVARVSLGTVTGANDVFVLSDRETDRLEVRDRTVPVVSRSAWLTGPEITCESLTLASGNQRSRMLVLPDDAVIDRRTRLGRHLSAAEVAGVNDRHHCRREPWWALGTVPRPDAFLPYTMGQPRGIALNTACAASTNTVHQITWREVPDVRQAQSWALSTWSAIGRVCAELYGRHYGGGVLKLELSAAQRLPVIGDLPFTEAEWAACRRDAGLARSMADAALLAYSLQLTEADLRALHTSADLLAAQRVGDAAEAADSAAPGLVDVDSTEQTA